MMYRNPGAAVEARVNDLLSRMTLKEKVGQVNQHMFGWNAYRKVTGGFELTEAFKEEVAFGDGMGALYGLLRADPWSAVTYERGPAADDSARLANQIQRYVIEHTRLGIPVLLAEECPHGHQALDGTMLPTGLGAAAMWNPARYEQGMACVAREIRSRGGHLGLVLNLDLARDPRWGRTEECLGEDPYLAARLAAAAVHGLQGRSEAALRGDDRVAAISKTFTAHGGPEGGRNVGPASIGERELREIHLPPAEAAARAGTLGFMGCYNEVDGIPCHANRKLLTGVLRDEWGFGGLVMADGFAVDRLVMQAGSHPAAAAMALSAGVDLSLWDKGFTTLAEAVTAGLVPEAALDQAVRRVLRVKFLLGLFENPYVDESRAATVVGGAEIREASLGMARESLVLLKNEGALLPLSASLRRVAIIGPNADQLYNQMGDYTPPHRPGAGVTVLQGVRQLLVDAEVRYAKGCGVRDASTAGFAEALDLARASEAVILVLGGSSTRDFDIKFDINGAALCGENPTEMDCGEGVDVADLELGGVQVELAKAVMAIGKPVVVVLIQGRPHAIPWLAANARAILCAWYPGPFGGQAVAEALFGVINPGGKLPVTVPRSAAMLPVYYNRKDTGRPIAYRDTRGVEYPFGHGLSYTRFEYADLDCRVTSGGVEVAVAITNVGECAGAEVVQLYIKDVEASITRRVKELKGFEKIVLHPGETRMVRFTLGAAELGVWNPEMRFAVEPGNVKLMIGASSEDIRLEKTVTIKIR